VLSTSIPNFTEIVDPQSNTLTLDFEPNIEGSVTMVVRAADENGLWSPWVPMTLDVVASAFQIWAMSRFDAESLNDRDAEYSVRGAHLDPDNDGIPNAAEAFAGSDPLIIDDRQTLEVMAMDDSLLLAKVRWDLPDMAHGVRAVPIGERSRFRVRGCWVLKIDFDRGAVHRRAWKRDGSHDLARH
jgi:hypothetical protein